MNGKIILITGASSGIGKATAELLGDGKNKLIICGRRKDRLEKLSSQINGEVHILNFDVRDKKSVFDSISSIPDKLKNIDVLINNAGNAHGMHFSHEADLDDWDAMIDSNVKGLMFRKTKKTAFIAVKRRISLKNLLLNSTLLLV